MTVGKISLAFFLAVLMAASLPPMVRLGSAGSAGGAAPVIPHGQEIAQDELEEHQGEHMVVPICGVIGVACIIGGGTALGVHPAIMGAYVFAYGWALDELHRWIHRSPW